MEASGLFYVRFMDDILVLAPTRWRLRKAVKAVNEVLGSLCLLKHPDKTFIGRIERGFDFPGYHFGPAGFTVAAKTIEQLVARAIRLCEQEPGEACASSRFGLYVWRWSGWAGAGLPGGKRGTKRWRAPLPEPKIALSWMPSRLPNPPLPLLASGSAQTFESHDL